MKTLEKIVYMTEKGQITLPVAWRRKVGTDAVRIKSSRGDLLEIAPVAHRQDQNTGWVSIFNAQRDNNGKGIPARDFLRELQTIKKEELRKKQSK